MKIVTNYKKEVESYTITFTPEQLRFIKHIAKDLVIICEPAHSLYNKLSELDLPSDVNYNVEF